MAIEITSNHHRREFLFRDEVPKSVLESDLDWTDTDGYIYYRGDWMHLSQFEHRDNIEGWSGIHPDSYFSGTVIKLLDDGCGKYKIGTFISTSGD